MNSELSGAPISILVADDDPGLREVLCLHLRDLGYEVHEATNGKEALERAQLLGPRLAILDITMPLMNGWEVAQRLRKNPDTADIKLLILSGIGSDVLSAGMPVFGGDLGLDKPFDLPELEAALTILLKV